MHDICSGKINTLLFTCLFLCFTLTAMSQSHKTRSYNYERVKDKIYYFGIGLGLNNTNYKIDHAREFIGNPTYSTIQSMSGSGFNLGVIGNLKLGNHFDLRTMVNFAFSNRTVEYKLANNEGVDIQKIESVFMELPFLVRFKSDPYKDIKAFVVTGVKYSYDLQNKSGNMLEEVNLNISPHDFQFELGAGLRIFMPFFVLSPEIKFSKGLNNILIHDNTNLQSSIINKLTSNTITFTLNFEG